MSCKRPVLGSDKTQRVDLPFDTEHKLHELNGLYHLDCARPYLSIMRALDALNRRSN